MLFRIHSTVEDTVHHIVKLDDSGEILSTGPTVIGRLEDAESLLMVLTQEHALEISEEVEAVKPSHNNRYVAAQEAWSEWLKYREEEHGVSFPEWLQVRLNAKNGTAHS